MKYLLIAAFFSGSHSAFAQTKIFAVYFEDNRSDLTNAQRTRLDSFIENGMQGVCGLGGFRVEAHTDSRGSDEYNLQLASKRLETVVNVFAKPNVRVCISGTEFFGERKLFADDEGDMGKGAVNRRVEIIYPAAAPAPESPATQASPQSQAAPYNTTPDTAKVSAINEALRSPEIKKGSTLILENLEFYGGEHLILPQSYTELKQLVSAMKEIPTLKISLEGHVCCVDGKGDGFDHGTRTNDLSFQRAKEVHDFLVFSGIDKSRISYRGFGHRYPKFAFPERNEEERTANRRVEVRIIEK